MRTMVLNVIAMIAAWSIAGHGPLRAQRGRRAAPALCARVLLVCALLSGTQGCAVLPGATPFDGYTGPEQRPRSVLDYYAYDSSRPYSGFSEHVIRKTDRYTFKQIEIETSQGPALVDYYQRKEPSPYLIFVFPILGGKHVIESYFAQHFASNGFDAAIVHRDKDFKNPDQFEQLEENFRRNVVRDRIAIDLFQREYGKTEFGSFGISRGGINVAITAGVDARLQHNVIALGGSHLVELFKHSSERGISKYRKRVQDALGLTEEEFYAFLEQTVKTDPKFLARYMDARKTLMILSAFDKSVPIKYGMALRREIGNPRTLFLPAGHVTGVLFTQFVKLIPPSESLCIFPFDVIESEALEFYNRSFKTHRRDFRHYPFILLKLPLEILGKLVEPFF